VGVGRFLLLAVPTCACYQRSAFGQNKAAHEGLHDARNPLARCPLLFPSSVDR